MHVFVGVARLGSQPATDEDEAALTELAAQKPAAVQRSRQVIFLDIHVGERQPSAGRPLSAEPFSCIANIHNRDEIGAWLGEPSTASSADLVRAAYHRSGDLGLERLRGAFAFALWDEAARALTLARDCGFGQSLFYHRAGDRILFASHLPVLMAHRDVPRVLDEVVVASFLAHDTYQHRKTFFRGVERVPPRHALTIAPGGDRFRAYWSPRIGRAAHRREDDYVEEARALLDRAVARSISDRPNFAVMASGGLDSAAILSTMARSGLPEIPCYTIIPDSNLSLPSTPGRYADERPKTEALARMYPALRFRYVRNCDLMPGEAADAERFGAAAQPLPNASRTRFGEELTGRMVADGFDVHIGGGAGNHGLTWSGAALLAGLARQGKFVALLREASATAARLQTSVARVLAREAVAPLLPLAIRRALRRAQLGRSVAYEDGVPLRREAIAEFDLPRVLARDGFDPLYPWQPRGPRDRASWLYDQNQLAHDNSAASPGHPEQRSPLGDRDLVEFALNVPESLYRRNGIERWFARRVLADRVPPEILNETRRGALHFPWFAALSAQRAAIVAEVDGMENSLLASRLFDIPRLRRLIADWPADAREAEDKGMAYMMSLDQAVHVARYIRWATGANA